MMTTMMTVTSEFDQIKKATTIMTGMAEFDQIKKATTPLATKKKEHCHQKKR
jgi:hypothetical protein